MLPRLVPVYSSNLAAVGYDLSQSRLYVQFRNGSIYAFEAVPPTVHTGLMNAASHGSYFWNSIRFRFVTTRIQ